MPDEPTIDAEQLVEQISQLEPQQQVALQVQVEQQLAGPAPVDPPPSTDAVVAAYEALPDDIKAQIGNRLLKRAARHQAKQ